MPQNIMEKYISQIDEKALDSLREGFIGLFYTKPTRFTKVKYKKLINGRRKVKYKKVRLKYPEYYANS